MEIIKTETHFNFVRMMKPAVILSMAVIVIGIASLIWHGGPNYGIDFAGGTLIQIKFQNETPTRQDPGRLQVDRLRGKHHPEFRTARRSSSGRPNPEPMPKG